MGVKENSFRQDLEDWILARPSMLYAGFVELHRAVAEVRRVAQNINADLNIYHLGSARLEKSRGSQPMDPFQVLDEILRNVQDETDRRHRLWILLYFHLLLKEPNGVLLAKLREIVDQGSLYNTVILVGPPSFSLPEELVDIPVLVAPRPGLKEIRSWLNSEYTEDPTIRIQRACLGLSHREVEDLFSLSTVRYGSIEPECIEKWSIQKRRQQAGGVLQIEYPQVTLENDVGGYEALKEWLDVRKEAFLKKDICPIAPPKGMLLLGVPGCGKSLICRALAGSWEIPLVWMDPSHLYASSLGETEQNLQKAIEVAESASPCMLWIDELEKGFAVTDPRTDGGVGNRLLGTILAFLQERSASIFVVGTANDLHLLPSEFLRRGRWDEIFFLDLPNKEDRKSILKRIFKRHGVESSASDLMVTLSEGFSGAELEQAVLNATYQNRVKGEPIGQWEILRAIREMPPLSRALGDGIDALRSWAKLHTRWASKPYDHAGSTRGRRQSPERIGA
jgi:AAA+ superfamily predicted ATPase